MAELFFDTETTGLPNRNLPLDHPSQPRLVQFAAILIDGGGRERASAVMVVRPDVSIPAGASNVHGITDEIAGAVGVPEKAAVGLFLRLAAVAKVGVAFNIAFDLDILSMAAARSGVPFKPGLEWRCACTEATPICALPPTQRMIDAGYGDKNKPPKLEEAVRILCGRELDGAHDAIVDVRGCIDVYRALEARGVWKEAA